MTVAKYAVIGDPVAHSMSPSIHNAAFAALGLDETYVAHRVAVGHVAAEIATMRAGGWRGLSVTMPHKNEVLAACDQVTESAVALGAVNCVFLRDGLIVGDNTDGAGFVRGLRNELDVDVAGLRCAVVGAGGAARAVIRSLADAGAAQVLVINRSTERAATAAAHAGEVGAVGSHDDLGSVDVVINATPLGMADTAFADQVPFDIEQVRSTAVVCDLIYHPRETKLLAQAKERGLPCQNGLAMLVFQAAVAFEHWTSQPAPVAVMQQAVEAAV